MTGPARTIAVVGAGHAGLCVVGALRRRGITDGVVVFDHADRLGDTWRERYDALVLNTHRDLSRIPDVPLPPSVGEWPGRDEWADHIEHAAATLGVQRRTERIRRIEPDDRGWRLALEGGEPIPADVVADVVVVATGRNRIPEIPEWPGREDTTIEVLHTADFRRADDFVGRRVLVVGGGNSATEVAHVLAAGGVDTTLSLRTRPVWARRELFGTDLTHAAVRAKRLPDRAIDVLGRLVQRLLFGNLAPYGLGPPEQRLSNVAHASGATLDSGIVDDVKKRRVALVDVVASFDRDVVVTDSGRRLAVDVVIAGTGFSPRLSELLPVDVLDGEWPAAKQPPFRTAPGLYTAGLNPATLTAFHPDFITEAEQIADAIAADLRA